MARDTNLKTQYSAFMREYLALEYMKQIKVEDEKYSEGPAYYLPCHCVIKPSSETTKLRVVFDASCKSNTGTSLNDVLMVGPTFQQDLIAIILRFQTFKFVFIADITKMYRQIWIHPSQTRLQRVLWRDDVMSEVRVYELRTVTYSTSAAPFLATRTLNYLSDVYAEEFPTGVRHVGRDFYVDDVLTGTDTIEDTLVAQDEIIKILSRGLFQLNKWAANAATVLNGIYERDDLTDVQIDKEILSRILGILWNPSRNPSVFRFPIEA